MSSVPQADAMLHVKRFELFKFYEEALQRTKSDAWTQTTWVLTLSGAILAFSIQLYVEHFEGTSFELISWSCAVAGVVLTGYVMLVLHQLATYSKRYLTAAIRLAAHYEILEEYITVEEAQSAKAKDYQAGYPGYILLLHIPPAFFAAGHIFWLCHVLMQSRAGSGS
jgi:hypothetical protein